MDFFTPALARALVPARIASCNDRYLIRDQGLTIIEALVATVVVAVVGAAAIFSYNNVASFLFSAERQALINAAIDNDLTDVRELAQKYTSCLDPEGGVPSLGACQTSDGKTLQEFNTYYYFPGPTTGSGSTTGVVDFETSCQSGVAATHITAGFIDLIDDVSPRLQSLGITKNVNRMNSSNPSSSTVGPSDYAIQIAYTAPGGIFRSATVSPYLSYWCSGS